MYDTQKDVERERERVKDAIGKHSATVLANT